MIYIITSNTVNANFKLSCLDMLLSNATNSSIHVKLNANIFKIQDLVFLLLLLHSELTSHKGL